MASIELAHASDVGMKRQSNEDAYVVLLPPKTPAGVDGVLVVADGMGGHEAGEVASAMAVQAVVDELGEPNAQHDAYPGALGELVERANAEIVASAQGDRRGMGTTMTMAVVEDTRMHLAHVGDSRAYLLRGGELRQLTDDHSWVSEQVRQGRLTPAEAATHPRRNLLTKALGAAPSVAVDTQTIDLEEGDLILLCSDGLHGVVSDESIQELLQRAGDLNASCKRLVQAANERGGPDNVTVVLARVSAGRPERPAAERTAPTLGRAAPRPKRRGRGRRLAVLALMLVVVAALALVYVLDGELPGFLR